MYNPQQPTFGGPGGYPGGYQPSYAAPGGSSYGAKHNDDDKLGAKAIKDPVLHFAR